MHIHNKLVLNAVNVPEPAAFVVCCCSDLLVVSGDDDKGVGLPGLEVKLSSVVVRMEADGKDVGGGRRVQIGFKMVGAIKTHTHTNTHTQQKCQILINSLFSSVILFL